MVTFLNHVPSIDRKVRLSKKILKKGHSKKKNSAALCTNGELPHDDTNSEKKAERPKRKVSGDSPVEKGQL